ncbi:hypothetical protein ANCCEY_13252 [Ancylostoma ceylanicum]|uniref:Protein kinase domain-containing protein n=1 Tax=Ancylostoma ceylanicum TaxID=53326 RepID=A0A0D6L7D3_9BILA|nr:hypothetical protein ANCCEY_13252 [Ancylostoma ceylanicum]
MSKLSKSATFHDFCESPTSRNEAMRDTVSGRVRSVARLLKDDMTTVVQESSALGSDGESVEVSPCTSDQTPTGVPPRYIVNVKMRQKPSRKWSEEEIQKRLSLPADLRLPVSVVEKLNRTPTLDQPLTRKNRRASLSEIGFGKLETYEKLEKLGEGTYATVYRGRSLLTNKFVALKKSKIPFDFYVFYTTICNNYTASPVCVTDARDARNDDDNKFGNTTHAAVDPGPVRTGRERVREQGGRIRGNQRRWPRHALAASLKSHLFLIFLQVPDEDSKEG